MPGRGDNNKNGSAGQGASNQSNQGFVADGKKQPKSNHGEKTGGKPSEPQQKKQDHSAHRGDPKNHGRQKEETW